MPIAWNLFDEACSCDTQGLELQDCGEPWDQQGLGTGSVLDIAWDHLFFSLAFSNYYGRKVEDFTELETTASLSAFSL